MFRRLLFSIAVLAIFASVDASSASARHGCRSSGYGYGGGYPVYSSYGYGPRYSRHRSYYGGHSYYSGHREYYGHHGYRGHSGVHFSIGF